jgi:predicted enzyme related to lactoylglutathione lyase
VTGSGTNEQYVGVRAEREPCRQYRKDLIDECTVCLVRPHDLAAAPDDADRALEFYAELFGWPIAPDSNPGPYNGLIDGQQQPWGAVMEAPDASTGHWVPYVKVDDLEQATASATSLGGTVVAGATDGAAGTAVLIADPAGALVALWVPFATGE